MTDRRAERQAAAAERNRQNQARLAALSPGERLASQVLTWLLLIGGVLGVLGALRSCGADSAPEALSAQDPFLVREWCLTGVREQLRAPSTARFDEPTQPAWAGSAWTWESRVEAQNALGVPLVSPFTCVVDGSTAANHRVTVALTSLR